MIDHHDCLGVYSYIPAVLRVKNNSWLPHLSWALKCIYSHLTTNLDQKRKGWKKGCRSSNGSSKAGLSKCLDRYLLYYIGSLLTTMSHEKGGICPLKTGGIGHLQLITEMG